MTIHLLYIYIYINIYTYIYIHKEDYRLHFFYINLKNIIEQY
jgi:hypothetical protein